MIMLGTLCYAFSFITSIVEVMQSRQQFAELKSSYIETLKDYQQAVIDLEIASGIFPSKLSDGEKS